MAAEAGYGAPGPSRDPEIAQLQGLLDRLGVTRGPKRVLEAGCGSLAHIRFENAHVVGIDISAEQLARHPGLATAICADLETWEPEAGEFDVVVCWDVLEHLKAPAKALANLVRAAKPGGHLVLALPNLYSLKGLATKLTPHRVHVWAYRRLWGVATAGTAGHGPFPTPLRAATAPGAMRRFARAHGLRIVYFSAYESLMQRRFRLDHPVLGWLLAGLGRAARRATGGRLDPLASDYILVLRKP